MTGLKLGRFLLKKWIGGGRFGDVYLAEDTLLKKDFAVKIIRVSPSNLDPLLEEARVLSELDHPNIVRFYTVDLVENRLIIVMEFVEGTQLRKIIDREAPLSTERAIFYMEQILDAIDFAHRRGVVHRDLKPENIIVTNEGIIKILDFGLAKIFQNDLSMSMGGTPLYMAPEAWKGNFSHLSDQWSCGAMLYEMLIGVHPYRAETLEELIRKINNPVEVPSCADIDDRLKIAIEKALSPDPQERFASCRDFLNAIKLGRQRIKPLIAKTHKTKEPEILSELTEEQKEAVFEKSKNVLLIGGPGTGKTHSLIARAVSLIKEGVSPSRILITTFSIRGYKEIESRLAKYVGGKAEETWIGNFHQIALRILSRFGHLLGLPEDFSIVPPSQRRHLAQKIARRLTESFSAPEPVVKDLLNRFHRARAGLLSKEQMLESATGRWRDLLNAFWDTYQRTIIEERALDYDDLIYYCAMLFKEFPEAAEFYRERLDHLLIDEAQDLNTAQIYILENLGKGKRLFVTGDDDQSIYQWRGGRPDYLWQLKNREDFKVYKLTQSFRLPKEIRDAAFNLIQFNKKRMPKLFWTRREGDRFYIDVRALNTPQEEADFVCDIIDILRLKEGYSYSDFCVLYRTNTRGRLFEQVFKKRRVPYSFQFGKSFYKREEVLFAMDLLKYAATGGPGILKRLKNRSYILGMTTPEADTNPEFGNLIESVREYTRPSEVLSLLIHYLGRSPEVRNTEEGLVRLNSIEELFKQAKDFEERSRTGSIQSFLNYLRFLIDSGLAEEDEGVRLLSVHAAKGLEFPVVFLVGMVEGEFPLSRAMGVEEEMEEERRLCYTAITRATEKLFITYYRFSSKYTRFEEKPSRFLREMLGI